MIYYWRSTLLKQWAEGHLLATAGTADEARAKIRAHFETWIKDQPVTDEEDRDLLIQDLESDLSEDPEIVECLFLNGSA